MCRGAAAVAAGPAKGVDEIAAQSWAEAEAEARAELGLHLLRCLQLLALSDVLGSIPVG